MTSSVGVVLAMVVVMSGGGSYAQQISNPCKGGMVNRIFTPCVNFITSSSGNGRSPTRECCSALKSLTSDGVDCLCLLVTATVPFKIPINRTIAISLPRACNCWKNQEYTNSENKKWQ
ncbi:putative bifunctional inhibitor/plant lipid transfer protein/seed storage helical [Lupinus albus]|uniref:Putative bifunctional inhibitor/plant lipid transfer protein/seed storage helical n=1 Tax=Lupinus albus TaxID=3870 RepID=A0A6A4QY04_LUPAL|nr:putative bifunctional inhibitor/plant lipid transfer protein/seed storage helical [Lupinus albus]